MVRTPRGLMEKLPISNPAFLLRHPGALADPETLVVVPGVPIAQEAAWLEAAVEPAKREVYGGL